MHRPFAQRYAILLANGRGAYQPLDLDSMEQRQLAEAVRKILQAAGLDGWQVDPTSIPCSDHSPFEAAGQIQMHPTGKSSGRDRERSCWHLARFSMPSCENAAAELTTHSSSRWHEQMSKARTERLQHC